MRMLILIILFMFVSGVVYPQTFSIKGNVSTVTGPVRYASVTFVDSTDTTKQYSTLTDTSGNYQIGIVTSVKPHENVPTKFELE